MKKIFVISCFLSLFSLAGQAQRYDFATIGSFSGGIQKNGFHGSLGYEIVYRAVNGLTFDLDYSYRSQKLKTYPDIKINISGVLGGIKYRRYFLEFSQNIIPYVSLGVFGGYEFISDKDKPETVYLERKNSFIYGLRGDVGIEYSFNTFGIFAAYAPYYDFKYKDYVSVGCIGVKIYL